MVEINSKKFVRTTSYGRLYAQDRQYFILSIEPVAKDSWQSDNTTRWLAVPSEVIGNIETEFCYSFARHIVVCGDYLVDYKLQQILVWDNYTNDEDLQFTIPQPEDYDLDKLFEDNLIEMENEL